MRKTSGGTSNVYYLLSDHLGSTVSVVNPDGSNPRNSTYYAFGASRLNVGGAVTDKLFTGRQLESSTGLYYYGARFYDPVIGRFISPDTLVQNLADPQALNRYTYTRNNPLKYVDPSGHLFWVPIIIGGAILIGMLATPTVANAPGPMDVTKPADELAPVKGAVANMPVTGDVNDVVSVVTGNDQLTGEELDTTDRIITGGAAALPVVTGPQARGSLKAAKKGAQYILPGFEGLVRKSKEFQIHHLAAHENQKWSSQFRSIASKYGLDLEGDWNKVSLPQL